MRKPAPVDAPVHDLIRERWSPRAFADRPVEPAVLRSLLEAARWAPSSFNEQPWAFLVADREQSGEHRRMVECLVEGNQTWAAAAPVLIVTLAKARFSHNDKVNRHAIHDVGLAVAQLTLQATDSGLGVHQMAGIRGERIRETYAVPEGWDPVTVLAIGYPGDPESLSPEMRELELAARERKPLETTVFAGRFGEAASF